MDHSLLGYLLLIELVDNTIIDHLSLDIKNWHKALKGLMVLATDWTSLADLRSEGISLSASISSSMITIRSSTILDPSGRLFMTKF